MELSSAGHTDNLSNNLPVDGRPEKDNDCSNIFWRDQLSSRHVLLDLFFLLCGNMLLGSFRHNGAGHDYITQNICRAKLYRQCAS